MFACAGINEAGGTTLVGQMMTWQSLQMRGGGSRELLRLFSNVTKLRVRSDTVRDGGEEEECGIMSSAESP